MLNNKTFLKVISLIIAILLWVYVVGEVNPDTSDKINDIEVVFINTDNLADRELAVVQDKTVTISAVIKGKRSDVNEIKKSGLTATVDVSEWHRGQNTGRINILLPDGIKLESISQETVDARAEVLVEAEKPVSVEFPDGANVSADTVPWVIEARPDTMFVSGARSSIGRIEKLKGTISAEEATGTSRTVKVEVIPVDADGNQVLGVKMENSTVRAKIQRLTVKKVNVKITGENLPAGLEIESIKGVNSIEIVGPNRVLKNTDEISAVVDLSNMKAGENKGELIPQLPEGCFVFDRGSVKEVKVKLRTVD